MLPLGCRLVNDVVVVMSERCPNCDLPQLRTVKQLSRDTNAPYHRLLAAVRSGELAAVGMGAKGGPPYMVRGEDFERYLAGRRIDPTTLRYSPTVEELETPGPVLASRPTGRNSPVEARRLATAQQRWRKVR